MSWSRYVLFKILHRSNAAAGGHRLHDGGAARTRSDTDHTDRFRRCDRQVCDAFGDRDKRTGNPPRPRQQSGRARLRAESEFCGEPRASTTCATPRTRAGARQPDRFRPTLHLIDEVGDRQRCGRGHGSLPDSQFGARTARSPMSAVPVPAPSPACRCSSAPTHHDSADPCGRISEDHSSTRIRRALPGSLLSARHGRRSGVDRSSRPHQPVRNLQSEPVDQAPQPAFLEPDTRRDTSACQFGDLLSEHDGDV